MNTAPKLRVISGGLKGPPKRSKNARPSLSLRASIALRNRYLGHLRTVVQCAQSGHFADSSDAQLRANELLVVIETLDTLLAKRVREMDSALGQAYFRGDAKRWEKLLRQYVNAL